MHCTHTNGGMVLLLLLVSWLFVIVLIFLTSGKDVQTAELKVLFFFLSSSRVILGSSASWTQWLRFFEGSALSSTLETCVFAVSPYDMAVGSLLFPLVSLGQLGVTAVLVLSIRRLRWVTWPELNLNRFIRTGMALLTFRYKVQFSETNIYCLTIAWMSV
jgi:hypothetical protein